MNGYQDVQGTQTMRIIEYSAIPPQRKSDITYANLVAAYKEHKQEKYRVRITVGGDKIHYNGLVYTPTADTTMIKILWHSVLATPNAKLGSIDIKNFYLGTHLPRPEYMTIR